jgi:CSLREA domain-containing protein
MSRRITTLRLAVAAALISSLTLVPSAQAGGPALAVTTTTDELSNNEVCSLREAITNVNDHFNTYDECGAPNISSPDSILVPPGDYTLTLTGKLEDSNATGDLDVKQDVAISSASSGPVNIQAGTTGGDSGNGIDRVFHVSNSASLTLDSVTVRYGRPGGTISVPQQGAGVLASPGNLTMMNADLIDNRTGGGSGGGAYVNGTLSLTNSAVEGNHATEGGGIYKIGSGSTSVIGSSTADDNHAEVNGTGGAFAITGGSASFNNLIASNNTSPSHGGAIAFCSTGTLTISGATFESNDAHEDYLGGGLHVCSIAGNATVVTSLFSENTGAFGGGIASESAGTVTVDRTQFQDNEVGLNGGGIYLGSGTLLVDDSSFDGNDSGNQGGGVYGAGGTMTVTNSSFHGNSAPIGGGIANPAATATIRFTTLSGNAATNSGAAADLSDPTPSTGPTSVEASILANSVTGTSCNGTITSLGYNIVENGGTCAFSGPGDLTGDPGLTAFDDHGGPTRTFALTPSSPALDHYAGASCAVDDQRGYPRPVDGPDPDTDAECDTGSYEALPLHAEDVSQVEGDPPAAPQMLFELTLAEPAPEPVTAQVDLAHVTTEPSDFALCDPGTIFCDGAQHIPAGQTSTSLSVFVQGDDLDEADETFQGTIASDQVLVEDPVFEGTIEDDDGPGHPRAITLNLRRHLKAKGRLTVDDTVDSCYKQMPVRIQIKKRKAFRTVETATTNNRGRYKTAIDDKPGTYRALAPKQSITVDEIPQKCGRALSQVKKHKH